MLPLTVHAAAPDKDAPTIPAGVIATAASCSQVNVSWSASNDNTSPGGKAGSGVKQYDVYRNGTLIRTVLVPTTSISDTGLTGSTTYLYQVTATDNSGNISAKSSTASATTPVCCTATVSVSATTGGTASGGKTVSCGTSVTVTASANSGYAFSSWTENGVIVSTLASYTFTANANRTLVANFASTACNWVISASGTTGGTVSGGGTVNCNSSVTVNASANSCYHFVSWTENGTVVSSSASYTFTATGNRTLLANFTPNTYTVLVSAAPSAGGSVTGGGTKNCGSSVTVTATAAAGYTFSGWTENGTLVSSSASYTFTASANRNLVANFSTSCTATISTSSSPAAGGSTSGGGTVNCGTSMTVTATPAAGYTFGGWTENGILVSSFASYTFTANASRVLVANFNSSCTATIGTSSSPAAGGSTSGGGTVSCGTSVTVTATPAAGYTFSGWTENGILVSSFTGYTFTANTSRSLVANFTQTVCTATITATASPSAGGTASGGTTVNCGTSVTVTASPNSCYHFVNWSENGTSVSTSASYTFAANASRSLVANFAPNTYTISASSLPANGGTTAGSGAVNCGSTATVTATAAAGYAFSYWTESGILVSSFPSYSFTATSDRSLVANFTPVSCSYNINTSSSGSGTTSGGGSVSCDSSVTVTATPNPCNQFVSWTENGVVVSTSASYTFTANTNRNLVANFSATSYTISASSSGNGTVSGGGSVNCGSSVTVTATPNSCYHFVSWTENGTVVSSSASYTFTASASRSLVANFAVNMDTVTASPAPSTGGSTTGSGSVSCGSTATVTASANSGYTFVNWTESGTVVSSSSSYSFTASANRTLVANFSANACTNVISTSSSPAAGGSTAGSGVVGCGSTVTVSATPNSCYSFVSWTENGVVVSTSASYSFTASGNRSLVANFTPTTYTISASSSGNGTVSGGGTVNCGSSVTVTATANSCYHFVSWTENGTVVSSSASYTFTSSGNRTLVANFAVNTYTITTGVTPASSGSTGGGGTVNCGASVTVTATANAGYTFSYWSESGLLVSSSSSYTFTASGNRTLVANFTANPCTNTITTSSSPAAGGTTSGGGVVGCSSSVTVTATANSGYSFVNWTESGTAVSASASYTFTSGGNRTLVANFAAASCSYSVSPSGASFSAAGGTGSASVTAGSSCSWTATNNGATWITITSGSSGTGNGTVNYSVAANTSTSSRNGTLTIAGQTYSISEAGASGGPDTTAPVVTWLSPAQNATLTGTVNLRALTTDNVGVAHVDFYYDNGGSWVPIGSSSGQGAVSTNTVPFDSTLAPNGAHYLLCQGFDAAGNNAYALVTVTISNGPRLQWVKAIKGTTMYSARSYSAAADSLGNSVSAGWFRGTVDYGAGSITSLPDSSGGGDAFIIKYNSQGTPAWLKQIGNGAGDDYASGVAVDSQNNIIVVGSFHGTVDFGGTSLTNAGDYDVFVAKYNSSGGLVWVKRFGGPWKDKGASIAVDASDNIFVASQFQSANADFGRDASGNPVILNNGTQYYDIALVKLSSAGTTVWAKKLGGVNDDTPCGVAVDPSGNVWLVGYFSTSTDLGGGLRTSTGINDGFIAKYSGATGNYLWDRKLGTGNAGSVRSIATDPNTGNIVVTGSFVGSTDFGGGASPSGASGGSTLFLAGYGSSGSYLWSKTWGGDQVSVGDCGFAVDIDSTGNLALTGTFDSLMDFGGGTVGGAGYFVASFALSGNSSPTYRWALHSATVNQSVGYGVTFDTLGHLITSGGFNYTTDFGGISVVSPSDYGAFAAQYTK